MRVQNLLAAAVLALEGASAHPTNSHAHLHKLRLRDVLSKRKPIDYDTSHVDWDEALKNVDWSKVDYNGDKEAVKADTGVQTSQKDTTATDTDNSTTVQSSETPSSSDSSSDSSSGSSDDSSSGSSSESSSGSGSCLDLTKLGKRATHQQDAYLGNYQNNIHPEASCKSSKDYSLTFVNKRGSKKTYWLWNKAGTAPNGLPNGMMSPETTKSFDLEDGQKATWSFDKNSLVGFSEDCGRASNFGGVPNCNVGEASFADGNTGGGSDGGSFYDVSLVPFTDLSSKGGSPSKIPMTISAPGNDDSSLTQCNYVEATQNSPGNFPPGKSGCTIGNRDAGALHVTVTFG